MSALIRLAFRSLRARKGRSSLTFVALLIALAFLTALLALARGVSQALDRHARASFLAGEVIVQPGVTHLPAIIPGAKLVEFDTSTFSEATVAELRARPDVVAVIPQAPFPYPASARANIGSGSGAMHYELDMPLFAVPADFVARDINPGIQVQGNELPVVISRRLLDVYNLGLAPTSSDLPKLSENGLMGFAFEVELGFSSFLQSRPLGHTVVVPARIVGFTDQPTLLGATVSMEQARALLTRLAPEKLEGWPDTYKTLLLFAHSDSEAEHLSAAMTAKGYRTTTLAQTLAGVTTGTAGLDTILGALALLVLGLSVLNLATTMLTAVRERVPEIGLLRALGATRGDVLARFLLEAGLLGLAAGICGAALGAFAAHVANAALAQALPDTSFLDASVVSLDPITLITPVLLGPVVAILGAFWPAWRASRIPPVDALRDIG